MVKRFGAKAVCAVGIGLAGVGIAGTALVGVDTPIWIVAALFFVQGAGMANVMPATTESIMSALPREKAGVGSAVSNTVRQVASALGVAVLGSVLSAVYRSDVADAIASLPAPARAAAGESLSGAYAVGAGLGPNGPAVVNAANDAYVGAMHWAAGVGVLIAALGVAVVLAWLPGRPSRPVEAVEPQVSTGEPELAPVS
jgi:Na+/melibiose symporter-like transporter